MDNDQTKKEIGLLRRMLAEGAFEKSLFILSNLPEDVQLQPETLFKKSRLYYLLGRYDEAIDTLQNMPEHPESTGLLKQCIKEYMVFLEGVGCYEYAVKVSDFLLERLPDDIATIVNQGVALAMVDRYEEAIDRFNNALQIDPNSEKALFNKGSALQDVGRIREAIACFDQGIAMNRSNALFWHHKAVCLLDLLETGEGGMPWARAAKYEEARQCLGKALRIDPNYIEARELLNQLESQ